MNVNIERMIHDDLPAELAAVEEELAVRRAQVRALADRAYLLRGIADAAGVKLDAAPVTEQKRLRKVV